MGSLAEEYGFHGSDGFEGTGESLMVVDPNEGFIFHILSDPTGQSAIWAAERVPDDSVGVVANMFTIRAMNLSQPERFFGSQGMAKIAKQYKIDTHCAPDLCDFTRTFSDGEYAHKFYSGRRMWGALRLLAPTFTAEHLSPVYSNLKDDAPYPATVPVMPAERISVKDFFSVHRDHYKGTQYDLTRGPASGAFGTPNRYSFNAGVKLVGNWERSISIFRTSDSHVVQARSWLPDAIGGTLWWGPYSPQGTVYTPWPAGIEALPLSYSKGHQGRLDKRTAFWAHRAVSQLAEKHYNAIHAEVKAAVDASEEASFKLQSLWESNWNRSQPGVNDRPALTRAFGENAAAVVGRWWELFDTILFKYADGWINEPGNLGQPVPAPYNYPVWWLKQGRYPEGPPGIPFGGGKAAAVRYPQPPPKMGEH